MITNTPKLVLAVIVLVMVSIAAERADAVLPQVAKFIKKAVGENILKHSEIAQEYEEVVEFAVQRAYDEIQSNPELANSSEEDKQALLLRMVTADVYSLNERIRENKKNEIPSNELDHEREFESRQWDPSELEDESLLIEAEDKRKMETLKHLDEEMGKALDDETKTKLKARTKEVLVELLNNEARQIALAVLSAYMSSGELSFSSFVPLLNGIKVKLVEFFINAVVDVLTAITGSRIELKPAPVSQPAEMPVAAR